MPTPGLVLILLRISNKNIKYYIDKTQYICYSKARGDKQ